jgi:small subunit ribosomal protein S11
MAASAAAEDAKHHGIERVEAFVKGIGSGRESALRAVQASDIYISAINDITPVPHNGCRPPKPRRV